MSMTLIQGSYIIAGLAFILALAGLSALRLRTPVDAVYLLLGILVACLALGATYILRDALRNVSLLLALVPFVLVSAPLVTSKPAPDSA